MSYAHSRASADVAREYSPTITEDDDGFAPYASFHSASASAVRSAAVAAYSQTILLPTPPPPAATAPQPQQHRRPSLASQQPSSVSDGHHTLHIVASRSNSGSVKRLASSSANQSRSELPASAGASLVDAPLSAPAPPPGAVPSPVITTAAPSCASSTAPISPIRSSLEANGFRLRARSELDATTRQEQVREARRKFDAKERAKEEKYAREETRKRERASNKEAQKLEREQARLGRTSLASLSSGAGSNGPARGTPARGAKATAADDDEKAARDGISFDQMPHLRAADDVEFKSPRRTKGAKHKTMGVWTAFMLWLRTRLLKLGRR
ncbi:hypothetical protein CDD83_4718 [Cordyceps sp. RAO-2017]|nr:hypothetical protein CDD83_4718 [Cordyceps sp. RAO-2017]